MRNEEQETGTIVQDTDYLEAMDQWLAMLDDHEASKTNNKDQVEALRQTQKANTQALQAEMATRMRDRVRVAEGEEEALRDAEDTIPPEEDTVYEDWSESELGDVPGRQSSGQSGGQHSGQSTERPLLSIRPLASGRSSVPSSSSKRSRISATPAREAKRFKIEPRVETMRKISQGLSASVERSIGGLSSHVSELAAAIRHDTEQVERLIKVESKLATVEGTLVEIKEGRKSDSKKLDAVLALLTSRQE